MTAKEVTEIVHWPGQDTPACEDHANKLKALGRTLGIIVSSTPWPAGGVCKNCENEANKK
jgi:hypothetical protein